MLAADTILQNRYLVVRAIGEGGMGAVYLAKDQRLGSTVALKETFFTDPDSRKAFEREAKLLANLSHPALPKVIDHFAEAEGQFLVMEYIPGDDLGEVLKRIEKPLPVANVLAWADQLLDVLSYLHSQQPPIIHRDIKPQNLKVNERGQIILLDFGLAKGSLAQMSRGISSSIFGYTLSYAPLEQIQGAGTDPRSDLYALAATLYHLLTGTTPPDALSRVTAVVNRQTELLRSAHDVNPDVPISVGKVLTEAMALKREERPVGARQMRAALHDAARTQTTIRRPPAVVAPAAFGAALATEQVGHTPRTSAPTSLTQPTREAREASTLTHLHAEIMQAGQPQQSPRSWITFGAVGLLLLVLLVAGFILVANALRDITRHESQGDPGNRNSQQIDAAQSNTSPAGYSNGSSGQTDPPSPKELPSTNQGSAQGSSTDQNSGSSSDVEREVKAQEARRLLNSEPDSRLPSQPIRNDIGETKSNGFYEMTLENAKTGSSDICGWLKVSPEEKAMTVRFTISARQLPTPSTENTDFLIVDGQGKRFEPACGDARYFNLFGATEAKHQTITLVYVLHRSSERLSFRFQHVGAGNPITFEL